jgi:hypothetical protein
MDLQKNKRVLLHESQCLSCKREVIPYLDIRQMAFITEHVCDVRLVAVYYKQEGERATGAWTRVKKYKGKRRGGGGHWICMSDFTRHTKGEVKVFWSCYPRDHKPYASEHHQALSRRLWGACRHRGGLQVQHWLFLTSVVDEGGWWTPRPAALARV